ncbi:hypothetical protein AUJ59_00835 [Candidatus Beckwithbacteria bacterium CG1_02_47_37]|uniref:Uncharacterized protein n=1 Tax=Candidatus Beckwithbacteria bacterium CG1_02_47_37 TaxID=1805034 RepID=A0A1J4RQQ2_9BACT|nr:MAG: hypothetical protein AUJ59_00835 [Candidatus Beckwithbacteria bacterium CG1_02_47_37]
MLKAKTTVEIEVDQDEIPPDWQQGLKESISSLDGTMVYFGSESKGVMKIKNIKIEENKQSLLLRNK